MRTAAIALLSLLSSTLTSASSPAASQSRNELRIPQPSSSPPSAEDHSWWQPVPPALQEFIAKFNSPHEAASDSSHHEDGPSDLRRRQKAPNGGPLESTTIATQMSPVTTYEANGTPVTFTQTFVPTPDPWAGPVNGQIGMGTIQGAIGTIRSDS